MRVGRKPKATMLKLVAGNPGKRPLNENEPRPRAYEGPPPADLSPEALEEWHRLAPELMRLGLLTVFDVQPFAAYCQAHGRRVRAERALESMARRDPLSHGLLTKTSNGNVIQNPLIGVANRAMELEIRAAAEFGFTPSSRSRVHGTASADSGNPFAEFWRPPA